MKFAVICKNCNGKMMADTSMDGRPGKCSHCGAEITVKAPPEGEAFFKKSASDPSTIKVFCPCGAGWRVKRTRAGLTGACWECGRLIKVQDPYADTAVTASPSAAAKGIQVTCPSCSNTFVARENWAGQLGQCPKCGKPVKIPKEVAGGAASSLRTAADETTQTTEKELSLEQSGTPQAQQPGQVDQAAETTEYGEGNIRDMQLENLEEALNATEKNKDDEATSTPSVLIAAESDEISNLLDEGIGEEDLKLDIEGVPGVKEEKSTEKSTPSPKSSEDEDDFTIKLTITCQECKAENQVGIDELGTARCHQCNTLLEE